MIRVSKLADYGILLMTWCAWRDAGAAGQPVRRSAAELAKDTGLPAPTVSKLLGLLSRAGVLDAQRGAHGGYALARAPSAISVADVIEAIEGPIALMDCLDASGPDCGVESFCPTRTNWDRINSAILTALSSISLQEMATPQRGWHERMGRSLQSATGDTR
ncbi:MAG: SUF system Fe-S cluster assembly regulator [Planctomycetota bacterium]|nr:SUF system Fe-S cluster assembly regulator [Planctomycetota bacterium]